MSFRPANLYGVTLKPSPRGRPRVAVTFQTLDGGLIRLVLNDHDVYELASLLPVWLDLAREAREDAEGAERGEPEAVRLAGVAVDAGPGGRLGPVVAVVGADGAVRRLGFSAEDADSLSTLLVIERDRALALDPEPEPEPEPRRRWRRRPGGEG